MRRKVFAVLMIVALILCFMPSTAFAWYGGKLGFLCVALKSYMKQRDCPDGYPSISSPFAHYFWLHEYNFIFLLFFFQAVTVP